MNAEELKHVDEILSCMSTMESEHRALEAEAQRLHAENERMRQLLQAAVLHLDDYTEGFSGESYTLHAVRKLIESIAALGGDVTAEEEAAWDGATHLGSLAEIGGGS